MLIDEATIDCYGEDEEHTALLTMIEEHVVCPFRTRVIGETIEVTQFEWQSSGYGMFAVCHPPDFQVANMWPKITGLGVYDMLRNEKECQKP